MKTAEKRLLALLLVLVMVAGFVPVTARADNTTPYIGSFSFGASATIYTSTQVDQYDTEIDNTYEVILPDTWTRLFFNATIKAGVTSDNLYCSAYHGTTKAAATIAVNSIKGITLENLNSGFKSLSPIQNLAKLDSEYWMKLVIGTGTNQDNPQTYYFHLVRRVALSQVSATDSDGTPIPVTLFLDSCSLVYSGEVLNLTCTAQTPAKAEIKVGETVVTSGQSTEFDFSTYPLNDGVREIPVSVKYTGTGVGADSSYSLQVDKNNYTPIVVYNATSYTCNKGETVELGVTATVDKGNLFYQWFVFPWSSGTGIAISGATNATYTVTSNTYEGEYRYQCQVINQYNGNTYETRPDLVTITVLPTYASEASIDGISSDQLVIQDSECVLNIQASLKFINRFFFIGNII